MHQDEALKRIEGFATWAHEGQLRKYTDDPYIIHPVTVSWMVKRIGGSFETIAAALLHDVLEDTAVTELELFGFLVSKAGVGGDSAYHIFDIVRELTEEYTKDKYPYLNRQQRKDLEADRLGKSSPEAQTIKRCDLEDNAISITKYDPNFAKVFLMEQELILSKMGD